MDGKINNILSSLNGIILYDPTEITLPEFYHKFKKQYPNNDVKLEIENMLDDNGEIVGEYDNYISFSLYSGNDLLSPGYLEKHIGLRNFITKHGFEIEGGETEGDNVKYYLNPKT